MKSIKRSRLVGSLLAILLVGAAPPVHWRDLNHNGRLDPYEDSRLSPQLRAEDLLLQMTLEEKIGAMMHGILPVSDPGPGQPKEHYDLAATEKLIASGKLNSFITRLTLSPAKLAEANNAVQRIAERSRLGIPVTISTDPLHHFQALLGMSDVGAGFSQWPETLGFAAIGDPVLVRNFGRIAAAEYRAVGIQMALSPQADLASEPRWGRQVGTFGSDPATVSMLAGAYVEGFQGGARGVTRNGVATAVKHWVGYGAEPDGFDAHNVYGRIAKLDRRSFAKHVAAFRGALAANPAAVMPAYAIVTGVRAGGKPLEEVGAGFNRQLLTGLLRGQMHYHGLIISDWAITNDCSASCSAPNAGRPQRASAIGMPWGVEGLSKERRFAKAVHAGVQQFGGVNDPTPLLDAVYKGDVTMDEVDAAVRSILILKFEQGLFDDSFVDPAAAARVVGAPASVRQADAAQRAAQVVLENKHQLLPVLPGRRRAWLFGINQDVARAVGFVPVSDPASADIALVRTETPKETLHPYHFFGARQSEGRLDFRDEDPVMMALARLPSRLPVVLAVDMDRPAILTPLRDRAQALLVLFGASDAALLDVVTGKAAPRGRLPFELPSSMTEVAKQDPAKPDDTAHPLYRRGAGLTLGGRIRSGSTGAEPARASSTDL